MIFQHFSHIPRYICVELRHIMKRFIAPFLLLFLAPLAARAAGSGDDGKLPVATASVADINAHADSARLARLNMRANRFFNQEEWASARAAFSLIISECPGVTQNYVRAIISSLMLENNQGAIDIMNDAINHHVPFDSIFTGVRRESFAIGSHDLYSDFLLQVKEANPWMGRSIDRQLLEYASFRNNPAEMVSRALLMLDGSPDNLKFLLPLARGYLLEGNIGRAMTTYSHILTLDPRCMEAILYLGNHYNMIWQNDRNNTNARQQATDYLSRAYHLHPTPYVRELLERLEPHGKK